MRPALSIPAATLIFRKEGLYYGMMRKILYVDDDLESRAIVAEYLRNLGYDILTVEQAADALRQATEVRLDAIILDVNLIGLDGPELLDLLQQKNPGVPVILYSGMNPNAEKVKAMLARGACLCLSKNAPLDTLVKTINEVLKHAGGVSRGA
jgi:CheY-like chemotaxis protein